MHCICVGCWVACGDLGEWNVVKEGILCGVCAEVDVGLNSFTSCCACGGGHVCVWKSGGEGI